MIGHFKSWLVENLPKSWVVPMIRLAAYGIQRDRLDDVAHQIFFDNGFHLLRKHFYLPIPDQADIENPEVSELVGVEMNDEYSLVLLDEVFPPYAEEFRGQFPLRQQGDAKGFYLLNGSYMAIDAQVYYAFIRHFKPRRIVEVGAGNSTLVAAAAIRRNRADQDQETNLTAIDPYPGPSLKEDLPELSNLIEDKIQNVPMRIFTSLGSGDILFIDSTHVLREGGDVQLEYCEILPRLEPGVIVHVHDISLPKSYPRTYFDQHLYWNEQYLLQALLAFSSRFEVIWPGNHLLLKYPEKVRAVFPEFDAMREMFPQSEPSSFWIRVKQ
jgi:hypothetical protein